MEKKWVDFFASWAARGSPAVRATPTKNHKIRIYFPPNKATCYKMQVYIYIEIL